MAPAFFVEHQPGSPLVKLSPSALACGSFFASLQPASVQAEIEVEKLRRGQHWVIQSIGDTTYARRKVRAVPVPTSTNIARSSFKARATRVNLSYFSFTRGTRSKNSASTIPAMDTKRANPDNPAVDDESLSQRTAGKQSKRTRPNVVVRLKAGHASKTAHSKEAEEGLRTMAYDSGLRDDHLQDTKDGELKNTNSLE